MSPQLPGLSRLTDVGRGGYGVVYRAWQEELRRYVAVKVLTARLDERAAHRFAQECQALGAVSGHPNIVAVHAAGTTGAGEPYLVMPFCDGGSLADRLRHGTVAWQEVLDIGVRIAGALQTAHGAGILHRDIKPGNILVDAYGTPRLADFGQARITGAEPSMTGSVVATPAYTAPEVLDGTPADRSSDVYSLAATLMTLIAGRGPFSRNDGEAVTTVMYRALHEPPRDLRGLGVPDGVCRVLEQGLARQRGGRPPSAAAFGEALREQQVAAGLPATPLTVAGESAGQLEPATAEATTVRHPTGRRTPVLLGGIVGILVLALVAGVLVALANRPEPRAQAAPIDPGNLLLVADDYGVGGLDSASDVPSVFPGLFGTPPRAVETDLARCLHMPNDTITRWQSSAVYTRGRPLGRGTPGEPYDSAESAVLLTRTAADAQAIVRSWNSANFDRCKIDVVSSSPALVGGSVSTRVGEVRIRTQRPTAELPAGASFAGKRVLVPIDPGTVYVDAQLLAYGRTVLVVVRVSYPGAPSAEASRATLESMLRKLRG